VLPKEECPKQQPESLVKQHYTLHVLLPSPARATFSTYLPLTTAQRCDAMVRPIHAPDGEQACEAVENSGLFQAYRRPLVILTGCIRQRVKSMEIKTIS
jgi:hypothetical protein